MNKTLIFDLDGTLTNPKSGICRSIQFALEKAGKTIPEIDDLAWCIGPPLADSFKLLVPEANENQVRDLISFYRERFSTTGLFENEIYVGIEKGLKDLSADKKIFMATSKPHIYAQQIAEHFNIAHRFQKIYGSELDGTRSDKSQLLQFLLDQENLDPRDCVMIGDRKHDVLGALKVGVLPVGVTWGYGSREELLEAGAKYLVDEVSRLSMILRAI